MLFTPSIGHIRFHNESSLHLAELPEKITRNLADQLDSNAYERFGRKKFLKPYFDNYALYNPFSESLRAFYPFVHQLKKTLQPGDCILDLSNRTGWTAFLLASFFPENKIISCWAGNSDVLGYQGFNYWFNVAADTPGIEILFLNIREKLPFEDGSIRMVFGYDTLHHQCRSTLLTEIKRVIPEDGFVFFPHVHLANNQPDPFFERGGDLLSGTAYEKFFSEAFPNHQAFVFSEPELFAFQSREKERVAPDPCTADYNGVVALLPEDFSENLRPYAWEEYHDLTECQALFNPMLRVNVLGVIEVSPVPGFRHHLSRHPCYLAKLTKAVGYELNDTERKIVYFIGKGLPVVRVWQKTGVGKELFRETLERLEKLDIITVSGVSEAARRLQYFFATQKWPEVSGERTLRHLWRKSCLLYSDALYIGEATTGATFTFEETDQIAKHVIAGFIRSGVKKGDVLLLESTFSPASAGVFWAAMQLGILCVPFNSAIGLAAIGELTARFNPVLLFTNKKVAAAAENVFFEGDEQEPQHFSNWLGDEPEDAAGEVYEDDPAVVLFTSGSTGRSKGVILTHAQLFESASNMVHTYQWRDSDALLAVGDMGSMSGLRNSLLVTALSGSRVVMMDPVEMQLPGRLAEYVRTAEVTILAGSPAFYLQLLRVRDAKVYTKNVRLGLVTGSNLTQHLLHRLQSELSLTIRNYYGLTETSGICIGEYLTENYEAPGSIGHCVDALVRLQPTDGSRTKGELYVFSEQLTPGYFGNEDNLAVDEHGWFRTKDVVELTEGEKIVLVGRSSDFIKSPRSEVIYFSVIEAEIGETGITDFAIAGEVVDDLETIVIYLAGEERDFETAKEMIGKRLVQRFGQWKVPIVYREIDVIPRTANGKVDGAKLGWKLSGKNEYF